jgi:hypothetical protein
VLHAVQGHLPETVILHLVFTATIQPRQLPDLVFDVYNRIPRRLHRLPTDTIIPVTPPPIYLQAPLFTLAPDQPAKPEFTLSWPLKSYDVLNRWRYVHAAYTYDVSSGLVVVCVVDSEGETLEVKTLRTKEMDWSERLRAVWSFCVECAEVAAIEWRMSITIASDGISQAELDNWGQVIGGRYVSLLSVDLSVSLASAFQAASSNVPLPAPILSDPSARITDDTLYAQSCTATHRLPILLQPDVGGELGTVYPLLNFSLSVNTPPSAGSGRRTAIYHVLSHLAVPARADERVDVVLAREFGKLLALGRGRYGFAGEGVALHVDAVRSVLGFVVEVLSEAKRAE